MNDEISHLTAGAAALLSETDERRIRAIRTRRWVLYPRAKQALDRLSALLELPSPFGQYRMAARRGKKLLDDEAERGNRTWTSTIEIARLLLMRRVIWPLPREHELWRYRVLGAIIPDLDHVVAAERENIPTPARPIMPLHIRPALLAGVAIVERAGPEILRMLREHMVGDNKVRFSDAAETMIDRAGKLCASGQMLLI